MYIKRDKYLKKLIDARNNNMIKIITGVRRCGKSFLLFKIFKDYLLKSGIKRKNIVSIELDSEKNKKYRNSTELYNFIKSKINKRDKFYIFLDEVQYAISKEELKNHFDKPIELYGVLNELAHLSNIDVYVTGSNSKLLSKDVMTEFRGRGEEIQVYPLSFEEYFSYIKKDVKVAFKNYCLYGGLPYILYKKEDLDKEKYLKNLFEEVYFKDIVERYNIELLDIMKEICYLLSSNIGSLTNVNKIVSTLKSVKNIKVNNETIYNYLQYLQDSFLFKFARRYDVKGKKYFDFPMKYYCVDVGLRNAILNFRQYEESHIMENIIHNELSNRGFSIDVGVVRFRNKNNKNIIHQNTCEIDFVVNRGMNKYYIQSALNIEDDDKKKQEIRPLLVVKDFFKKFIITKDDFKPWIDDNGIIHIGIYDFLLNKDSLDY